MQDVQSVQMWFKGINSNMHKEPKEVKVKAC